MSHRRGVLGSEPPLSIAALDAAITETRGGQPPRSDRLARDDCVYRWIVRRAIAQGSLSFRTTYAEAAAGAGYDVPRLNCRENRREARERRVSTVYRALCSLAGAGLVRFRGLKRPNGQWRCLSISLLPAAFGRPPAGRSRRGPRRCAGRRVLFARRSGTSPAVATAKSGPDGACVRARARREGAERAPPAREPPASPFAAAVEAAMKPEASAASSVAERPWPNAHFDVRLPGDEWGEVRRNSDVSALVDLFESELGRSSYFSFRRHGPQLRRILQRMDRYRGLGHPDAERESGYQYAARLIRNWGQLARAGNVKVAKIGSLAYLLPRLDAVSKARRRRWKRWQRDCTIEDRLAEGQDPPPRRWRQQQRERREHGEG